MYHPNPLYSQVLCELPDDHAIRGTPTARIDRVTNPPVMENMMLSPGETRPDWPHPMAQPMTTVKKIDPSTGAIPVVKI